MSRSPAEAYELITHAAAVRERLQAAMGHLGPELQEERSWLLGALTRLADALEGTDAVLDRAVDLPELGWARTERAKTHRAALATALEWLQFTLVRIASSRAPIVEALFPARLKLAALRKMAPAPAGEVVAAFEKRLSAAYVQRMLAQEDFASARDAVEQLRAAIARWRRTVGAPAELPDADSVRRELAEAAARVEVPLRQARALAEAALAPIPGAFESSGIGAKARRRAATSAPETAAPAGTPADEAAAGPSASTKDASGAEPADPSSPDRDGAGTRDSDAPATKVELTDAPSAEQRARTVRRASASALPVDGRAAFKAERRARNRRTNAPAQPVDSSHATAVGGTAAGDRSIVEPLGGAAPDASLAAGSSDAAFELQPASAARPRGRRASASTRARDASGATAAGKAATDGRSTGLARKVASGPATEPDTARAAGASLPDSTAAEDEAVPAGERAAPNGAPNQSGEIVALDAAQPPATGSEPVTGS